MKSAAESPWQLGVQSPVNPAHTWSTCSSLMWSQLGNACEEWQVQRPCEAPGTSPAGVALQQSVSASMLQRCEAGSKAGCVQQHHAVPSLLPVAGLASAVEAGSHPLAPPPPSFRQGLMCLLQRSKAAAQAPRLQLLTTEVTQLRARKREAGAARRRADLDTSQAQEALASVQAERQALHEDLAEARQRKASGPQVGLLGVGSCSGWLADAAVKAGACVQRLGLR